MARWYALDLTGQVLGGIPAGAFEAADRAEAVARARRQHGERGWLVQSVLDYTEAKAEQAAASDRKSVV